MAQQTQRTFAHANLLQTSYGLVVYVTDLLRGNWCNGFWPLGCLVKYYQTAAV